MTSNAEATVTRFLDAQQIADERLDDVSGGFVVVDSGPFIPSFLLPSSTSTATPPAATPVHAPLTLASLFGLFKWH